jgi:superfamily II DNA or RNA helicase
MSIITEISTLSKDQLHSIVKNLSFCAVDPSEELNKFSKNKKQIVNKTIIQMYSVENNTHIKLPYTYATNSLGLKNNNIFEKVFEEPFYEFQIDLKEIQIPDSLKALDILQIKNTVILGLPPGFGKTIIGAWLSYVVGYSVCVFFHRDTIGKQWLNTFLKCYSNICDKIWVVGERDLLPNEIPLIILCMNTRYDKIPNYLINFIGTMIVDECHLFCTPSNKECLLYLQPKYIIMETATIQRDDKLESMIYSISGKEGVFQTLKTDYKLLKINTHIKGEETFTDRGINAGALYKSLAENENRNNIILNIIKNNPQRKYMVLSKLATHIDTLKELFIKNGLECDTLFRSKSNYSDSNILLGTLSKISTGFDESTNCSNFKGIKSNVLILTHTVKKWQLFTQIRGRMRYDENGLVPIFIWLSDKNNMCKRHFKDLVGCIEETNGEITEIDYYEDQINLDK